jgi:hypothetical protein
MKNLSHLLLIFFTLLLLNSCARIYSSPDATVLAEAHNTIAILPPTVSIAASRKIDADALKEQQKTESLNFQKEMYAWLLRRKTQKRISQEILDIETTNTLLSKAGYPNNPMTPAEMAQALGVDGVIASNFSLTKPMSDGMALATGILFGAYGNTNEVRASISVYDKKNKKLIWNFDRNYSGSIGSSHARLVNALMRRASKKMPY